MNPKPTVKEIQACSCDPERAYKRKAQNPDLKMWFCDYAAGWISHDTFIGHDPSKPEYVWRSSDDCYRFAALEEDLLEYRKTKQPTVPGHNPANAPIDNLPAPNGRFLDKDEIYQGAPLKATGKVWYWTDRWFVDGISGFSLCRTAATYYTTMSRQESDAERRKELIERCGFKIGDRVTDLSGITGAIESLRTWLPTDPIPDATSKEVFDACETKKPFVFASYGACSCPVSQLTPTKP